MLENFGNPKYKMAMKKYPKRRALKRKAYRKKKGPTITALKALVVPDRLIVKLPYFNAAVLTAANGVPLDAQYRLNSIYDPDRTGVGHQPLGYDNWNSFYNRYRVFKVGYNIQITNVTAVAAACIGGLTATNGVLGQATDASAFEQPHCRKFQIGNSAGTSTKSLKGFINLPYVSGRPVVAYKTDDRYAAPFGMNPEEALTLALQFLGVDSQIGMTLHISVKLVYFCELYDPKILTLSSTSPLDPEDPVPTEPIGMEQNP